MKIPSLALCVAASLAACGEQPGTPVRPARIVTKTTPAPHARAREEVAPTATAESPAAPEGRPALRTWGGVVVDPQGRPVTGARVESGERSAVTSEDGAFTLTGLRPKRADLVVTAPGFARRKLNAWPGREDLRIELPREVRATGVVVHADGRPAEGAKVNHVCTTGADGRFDVPIEEERHNVFVTWGVLPGTSDDDAAHGNVWLDVDPQSPPKDVRVVLDKVCSWVGVAVTHPDGRSYEGATVWYVYDNRKYAQSTASEGVGSWAPAIPPGTEMELRVDPRNGSGGARVTVRTRTLSGVGDPVRVTLSDDPPPGTPPEVEFRVRVVDQAGTDVPDVRFHDVELDDRGVVRARPGADGTIRVRVGARGFVETTFPVAVVPSAPAETRLVLVRAGHVAVSVTEPTLASRTLALRVGRARASVTGSRSDIASWDIDPGEARVVLYSDEGGVPEWWRTVRVEPGGTTQVVCDAVRAAPVRGRVVGADGRPLGGVGIDLRPSPRFGGRFDEGTTCTAADGTFELPPIDADVIYVAAFRDDLAPAWLRFEPHQGGIAELRMTAGGTIVLRTASDDSVDSDAYLEGVDGDLRLWRDVDWDDAGRPAIQHAPPGRWRLKCTVSHEARESVIDVRAGETTVADLRE